MHRLIRVGGIHGHPDADCLVVKDGLVAGIGNRDRFPDLPSDEYVGWMLPALRDAHIHPSGYAAAVTGLTLDAAGDFAGLVELVRQAASDSAPGAPVVGARLDEHALAEGRLPDRHDLDAMLSKRPILLTRSCGHVAIANSSALRMARIGPATPDPPGGTIVRDETGSPTGELRETAIGLVSSALAADTTGPGPERLLEALTGLTGLGIGAIHAVVAGDEPRGCGYGNELDDLLSVADRVPIDVDVFVIADTPTGLESAAERIASAGGRMRWAGWKGFADGSLGGRTAALSRPYADGPGTGTLRTDPIRDRAMIERTLAMGGTSAIHAIGDAAIASVLDLYESFAATADPSRLRVEHASIMPPGLVGRMASLGVTACVQPAFMRSDAGWIGERLGEERTAWAYPLASLHGAGVPLLAGSDAPVENPDPWAALAVAVDHPLNAEESLGHAAALATYVPRPLRPADPATFVVVDRDPTRTGDPASTRVVAFVSNGRRLEARPLPWPGSG